MGMEVSLNELRSLLKVAELGSFSEASHSLNISQPALSRRIRKLELALGVQLFDRTTRKVGLSMVARSFVPHVRHIVDQLDASLLSFREIAERTTGQVTVACLPTTAFYFMHEVIHAFNREFPKIRVKIIDDAANVVLRSVLEGEADLGINLTGYDEADADFEPLLEEPFVLTCLRSHPLAKLTKVRWKDLTPYRVIMPSRLSGNRLIIDQALSDYVTRPKSLYEVKHLSTSLGMIEEGLGVAAVPLMAIPRGRNHVLVTRELVDPVVKRTIGIIRRRGSTLSPAAHSFYQMLKIRWQNVKVRTPGGTGANLPGTRMSTVKRLGKLKGITLEA
jgi:DNA-binding transcriptional LysR family regulator